MDVRSLYTNIANNEGIKAVETMLKRKKVIISFLKLILTSYNNNKNIYKKTFSNTIQKRNRPAICLHQKSEHPETLKQSIPSSQALRLKRICITQEDFTEQSKALTKQQQI